MKFDQLTDRVISNFLGNIFHVLESRRLGPKSRLLLIYQPMQLIICEPRRSKIIRFSYNFSSMTLTFFIPCGAVSMVSAHNTILTNKLSGYAS